MQRHQMLCTAPAGSSLEALFLNINNLTSTIPSSIPKGSQLQALALGANALTGDPHTFGLQVCRATADCLTLCACKTALLGVFL